MIRVLSLPDGERWWYGAPIAQDHRGDLWGPFGHLPNPGPIRADADGLHVLAGRIGADGLAPLDPDPAGLTVPGWDSAPEGLRRAACRAMDGGAVWWWDAGVLYRRTTRGIWPMLALPAPPALAAAPDGTALVDGRWLVADRPVALERPIVPDLWVRFAEGAWHGLCDDLPVRIGPDGSLHAIDGIPWAPGERWRPAREPPGPPARSGRLLAGPAQAIWDLAAGARVADLPAGLVVSADPGFVVVRRDGTRILWVDALGRVVHERAWSIGDDVVTRLAPGPVAVTAEGRAWRLAPDGVAPGERPRPIRRAPAAAPVPVDEVAEIEGVTWGWRADGLIVSFTPA